MTMDVFKNFIGGAWRPPHASETLASVNPARRSESLGVFPVSDTEDVAAAVAGAREAAEAWRATPMPARGALLRRVAQHLEAQSEMLVLDIAREVGKPLVEARYEVMLAVERLLYFLGQSRSALGEVLPSGYPGKTINTVRVPVGVVAAITPWNFPLYIPCEKLVPALVIGNTAVLKPSEDSPLVASRFAALFHEAGVPSGVLNVVFGDGDTTGRALVENPDVDLISFTGSTAVGRFIGEVAGRQLKRTVLEMGGKNPIIILEDADLDFAVDQALWSAFGYAGQKCTAASRILLDRRIAGTFQQRLVERATRLTVGDSLDEGIDVGPIINASQLKRIETYVEIGRSEGAEVLCGGRVLQEGRLADGFFYAPTVFGGVQNTMRIAQEEVFGPVTAIIEVESVEEAVAVANDTAYGLSAGIYTRDLNKALYAVERLRAGGVYVNGGTSGAEIHVPFGGMKNSGTGHREGGAQAAFESYSEVKTVVIDYQQIPRRRFPKR